MNIRLVSGRTSLRYPISYSCRSGTPAVLAIAGILVLSLFLMTGSAGAITGGTLDGSAHPNVAYIVAVDSQGAGLEYCSGTLIAPTIVLTAAHCAGGDSEFGHPAGFFVSFSPDMLDSPTFIAATGQFDPAYMDPATLKPGTAAFDANAAHDLGVITLDQPASAAFPGITPARLPHAGALDSFKTGTRNRYFTLVGYGNQLSGPPGQSSSLFAEYARRTTTATLDKLTPTLLYLDGNLNDAHGGGGGCFGDSGGPAFLDGVLVAMFSAVNNNCQNIVVDVRLDAGPARDFLAHFVSVP